MNSSEFPATPVITSYLIWDNLEVGYSEKNFPIFQNVTSLWSQQSNTYFYETLLILMITKNVFYWKRNIIMIFVIDLNNTYFVGFDWAAQGKTLHQDHYISNSQE